MQLNSPYFDRAGTKLLPAFATMNLIWLGGRVNKGQLQSRRDRLPLRRHWAKNLALWLKPASCQYQAARCL